MGKLDGKRIAQSGPQTWILLKDDGIYGDFPHARVECSDVEAAKQLYQFGKRNNFDECFSGLITEEEALRRFKPGAAAAGTYDATHQTKDGAFHYADWTKSLREHIIELNEFGYSELYVKQGDKKYFVFATNRQRTSDQVMTAISRTESDAIRFQDPNAVVKDVIKKLQDRTVNAGWSDDHGDVHWQIEDDVDNKTYLVDFNSYRQGVHDGYGGTGNYFACTTSGAYFNLSDIPKDMQDTLFNALGKRSDECDEERHKARYAHHQSPNIPVNENPPMGDGELPF